MMDARKILQQQWDDLEDERRPLEEQVDAIDVKIAVILKQLDEMDSDDEFEPKGQASDE